MVQMKKQVILLITLFGFITSCGMYQSFVKSSFPYTTTFTVPASAQPGNEYSAVSIANSFDQSFSGAGNNADKITLVHVSSAKLMSQEPTDYNIGNLVLVKIYLSKEDGKDEILVASRIGVNPNAGNNIILDIDNSKFLDELVREPSIRVRMAYKVRKSYNVDVSLHVVLGLTSYPKPQK
jgi:hypothetical protein